MVIKVGLRGPGHLSRTYGWTPAELGSSLLGWWDAERTDKLTLSGSSVTTWTDIVGNYAVTQAVGAAKPVWGATSFNGRPGVTFDGSDDELTLASVPFPTGASPCEMWLLVDQVLTAADVTERVFLAYGGGSAATARRVGRTLNTGTVRANVRVGNGASNGSADTGPSPEFVGRHVIRAQVGAVLTEVSIDGGTAANTNPVPATGSARTRMGATDAGAGANFFQGVASFVAITDPLTTAQATQLTAYLKARGGIA